MIASFVLWPLHVLRTTEAGVHHLENRRSQIPNILPKHQLLHSWENGNDGHCDGSLHGCVIGCAVNRNGDFGGGFENGAVVSATSPSATGQSCTMAPRESPCCEGGKVEGKSNTSRRV